MNTLPPVRFKSTRRVRAEQRFTCRTLGAQPYAFFTPALVYAPLTPARRKR